MHNTRDLMKPNEHWRIFQCVLSFKNKKILFEKKNSHWVKTPMIGFHIWSRRCEGVGQDLGYGHEESHLIHEMKHSM